MKLLLDQNLSQRLLGRLERFYPDSKHVKDFGLTGDDDGRIWSFAGNGGYVLVSKDSDFYFRSIVRGHPPKFVFLRVGNCSTSRVAEVLLANAELLADFAASDGESVLILE